MKPYPRWAENPNPGPELRRSLRAERIEIYLRQTAPSWVSPGERFRRAYADAAGPTIDEMVRRMATSLGELAATVNATLRPVFDQLGVALKDVKL